MDAWLSHTPSTAAKSWHWTSQAQTRRDQLNSDAVIAVNYSPSSFVFGY
jgi:hypothetical protein